MADTGQSASLTLSFTGASASDSGADTLAVKVTQDSDLAVDALDSLEVKPSLSFTGKTAAGIV